MNKWAKLKEGLRLIRAANEITSSKYTKKRNRSGKAKPAAPTYVDIEEMSDDYSVHSECSVAEV